MTSGCQVRWTQRTDDFSDGLSCRNDSLQRSKRAALQIAIEEPVERRVALDTRFGEDYEIRIFAFGLFDPAGYVVGVGFEVALDGVDFTDSDAHVRFTLYSNSNCWRLA